MKRKTSQGRRRTYLLAFVSSLLLIVVAPIHQAQATTPASPTISAYEGPRSSDTKIARFGMSCGIQEYCFGNRCEQDQLFCAKGVQVNPATESPGDVCWGPNPPISNVRFCVGKDGDYVWAKDTDSDGHGVSGEVGSPTGQYQNPQARLCLNREGAGKWARCNFDWPEGNPHLMLGQEFWNYGNDWCCSDRLWIQD